MVCESNSYTIELNCDAASFYTKIAQNAGLPVEQVLSDALFMYAGELSLKTFDIKK